MGFPTQVTSSSAGLEGFSNLPGEDNSSSSLDIIVEALVLIAVPIEVVESLFTFKVLKLHNHVREDFSGSLHELVHELLLLGNRDTLLTKAQVERVLQVGLVGGTAVEDDRERLVRVNTSSSRVQSQLTDLVHVSVLPAYAIE